MHLFYFLLVWKTSFIFSVYGVIELANLESLLEVNREVLEKRALGKLILFLVSYKADFLSFPEIFLVLILELLKRNKKNFL